MEQRQWISILMIVCACAVLGSGCKSFRNRGDRDNLDLEEIDGDIGLNTRFEDGELITDVDFENVMFSYDSYQIEPTMISRIEAVGDYMRSNRDAKLVAEGHCDERGSREYNMALGEHRSLAVRAHLVRLGIDNVRIQTRSYGEERPANPGHTASAWQQNRRVEFKLYR